jgi:hypothetical protein
VKTELTFDEMVKCLDVWGQTIGCENCGRAWWGEDATYHADGTPDLFGFHADGCPLKGREDVHKAYGVQDPEGADRE